MIGTGANISKVENDLSRFKCSRESDIEKFLHHNAIPYEKAHKSRTYLVVEKGSAAKKNLVILAYFSVAISRMIIQKGVSRQKRRKLNGIGEGDSVPCYLIGQLGKNDEYREEMTGDRLISYAMTILQFGYERIGGRFVRVDCREIDGLCKFYQRNGFERYPKNEDYVQFVRYF